MENSTLESGEEKREMEEGGIFIKMEICMKEIGVMISDLVKGHLHSRMEESIEENS